MFSWPSFWLCSLFAVSMGWPTNRKLDQTDRYFCKKIECLKRTEFCSTASCTLKLVNRTTQFGSFGCELSKPITQVHIRVSLFLRINSAYKPFLIDLVEDGCPALAKYFHQGRTSISPYLKTIAEPFLSNSNVNHSCPLMQNVSVSNWNINEFIFKDLIPSGEYLIKTHLYDPDGDVTIFKVNTYFVVPGNGLLSFNIGK